MISGVVEVDGTVLYFMDVSYSHPEDIIRRTYHKTYFYSSEEGMNDHPEEPWFIIYEDINNTRLSKQWWRDSITKELDVFVRKQELKMGYLI